MPGTVVVDGTAVVVDTVVPVATVVVIEKAAVDVVEDGPINTAGSATPSPSVGSLLASDPTSPSSGWESFSWTAPATPRVKTSTKMVPKTAALPVPCPSRERGASRFQPAVMVSHVVL